MPQTVSSRPLAWKGFGRTINPPSDDPVGAGCKGVNDEGIKGEQTIRCLLTAQLDCLNAAAIHEHQIHGFDPDTDDPELAIDDIVLAAVE